MRNRTTNNIPILQPYPRYFSIPDPRRGTSDDNTPSGKGGSLRHVCYDPTISSFQLITRNEETAMRKGTDFGIEKIIELAKPSCILSPFRWVCNLTTDGSGRARGETNTGPTGQKLSKPLISLSLHYPLSPPAWRRYHEEKKTDILFAKDH